MEVQIFRFSIAQVKVHQTSHAIFQTKNQVFFKVWIFFSVMRDNSSVFFLAKTLYAIDKSGTSKCKSLDSPLLALKFTKFLVSFLKPRVNFSSTFVLLLSVFRHNSSVLFYLNLYKLWTKGFNQCANFQTFNCAPNSLYHFSRHKSAFLYILAHNSSESF